jgi:Beta-fructosidases (levanase/invertase)
MWECPDFFELDGKHVLLTSPQDMLPEGLEFHNGNGTLCIIGEMDPETHTLKEETVQSVDYGMDYYAMQTLLAPDGRRIMIAWMQNWDTTAHRCNDSKWFAQMSLPREVSVKNGRLYQTPIKELDAMRKDRVEYNDVVIDNDAITLDKIEGRTIDMELVIRPEDKENVYKKFVLRFAQNEKFYTELSFRPDESVLKIDRKFSGTERALVHQRRCLVNGDANELKLRVILDRFSAEIFINDGKQVMSAVIFTEQEAKGISFFAEGAAKIDIVKYNLV